MSSSERAVLRELVAMPAMRGFRVDGNGAFKSLPPDANDLGIFLQTLSWSSSQDEMIVTLGVRSKRLQRFDAQAFGMPLRGSPKLGLLHYERSLGWLLGQEEPRFSGTPEEIAGQISPLIETYVIPDLEAHASDQAIAGAMLAHEPLRTLTPNDLMRLAWLLDDLGDTSRLPEVQATLSASSLEYPTDEERRLIADVTADIERAISGPDFRPKG
jgi:hypothetical protein